MMSSSVTSTSTILLYLLLVCSSVDAFRSTNVARPVVGKKPLPSAEIASSHTSARSIDNENAFLQLPSITSYRYSTSTSLHAYERQSVFRSSSETRTASDAGSSSSPRSSKRTLVAEASQTALKSLTSLQITSKATRTIKRATQSLPFVNWSELSDQIVQFVMAYWWAIPSFLALVPLYTTFVLGVGDAAMPHWWPVTKMDHIVKAPDAATVIGFFLFSNIAYFLSGAYLVKRFPFVVQPADDNTRSTISSSSSGTLSSLLMATKSRLPSLRTTRQTWLGLLLLSAGFISTVFHTEQALGSFAMANSLCYLDHAVAGMSCFYYFHTCALPSPRVWALGIAGLVCLGVPLPGYAWLHSAWHFLSAAAAVLWALESFGDETASSSSSAGRQSTRNSPAMVKAINVDGTD